MSKLTDLLGRKKPKIEIPAYVTSDNSQLHRRMNSVLSRPTRKELNPPQLTPDDYALAGYNEPPPPPMVSDESVWQEDADQDQARAVQKEAGVAVPAQIHDSRETPGLVSEEAPDSASETEGTGKFDTAESGMTAIHGGDDDNASSYDGDDELEKLRERLKERLEALAKKTGDEPQTAHHDGMDDGGQEPLDRAETVIHPGDAAMAAPARNGEAAHDDDETLAAVRAAIAAPPLVPENDGLLIAHEEAVSEVQAATAFEPEAGADSAIDGATSAMNQQDGGAVPAISRIPMPASLADAREGGDVADLAVNVSEYLMFEAGYYPEELPRAVVSVWCMDYLMRNLSENGLGAFVYNAWGQPDLWAACAEGLKACGAAGHLDALEALSDLVARDPALAQALQDAPDAGRDNTGLEEIEDDLANAERASPLMETAGLWLLKQDVADFVDDDAFQDAVTALGEVNGLEQRREDAA